MHEIDARVEQRHRDACAREAGNADVGPPAAGNAAEVVDAAGIDRGRDRRPHGEHSLHVGVADSDRERAGIERRREAVEHAVVRVLGLDRSALEREPREHLALRRPRGGRPGALLLLGGDAACRGDTAREGRLREDDDPAATELRRGPVAEQALPPGRGSLGLVGAARTRDEQQRSDREHRHADAASPPRRAPPADRR